MFSSGKSTWPTLADSPVVLVPVGSTEQHGPHLPVEADSMIAAAVAVRVAGRLGSDVWVAPPIAYGSSGEHQGFPGTMSIGNETLHLVLVELVRSLSQWAGLVVFVNAHGGNVFALRSAVTQLVHEGHDVCWISCVIENADAHAGHTETSLLLHLDHDVVDLPRAVPGNVTPIGELLPSLMARGVLGVSSNGVLGDPTMASASIGERLLARLVDDVHDQIVTVYT